MSAYQQAVREMLDAEISCPRCGAINIPNRKPTIDIDPRTREANCATCGHAWILKEHS